MSDATTVSPTVDVVVETTVGVEPAGPVTVHMTLPSGYESLHPVAAERAHATFGVNPRLYGIEVAEEIRGGGDE